MIKLEEYFKLTLKDKILFFDESKKFEDEKISGEIRKLFIFFKKVILCESENNYIKRKAIEIIVRLAYLGKIKPRQILTILLDEWISTSDMLLECFRIRKLALFYEYGMEEISDYLNELLSSSTENYEVIAEINYQFGMIKLFEINQKGTENDIVRVLSDAKNYFILVSENEENRVDALSFILICDCLCNIIFGNELEFDLNFKKLKKLIQTQMLYNYSEELKLTQFNIFNVLSNLRGIVKNNSDYWIDYKKEFNKLCYIFYEIENSYQTEDFVNRVIATNISGTIISKKIEPIFALNFKAVECKIDKILDENDLQEEEEKFLCYLKTLIAKKKENKIIEQRIDYNKLEEVYNGSSKKDIKELVKNIIKEENPRIMSDFLNEYYLSYENLLKILINACIKMQGNILYKKRDEDSRNKYIADMLEASGFRNKDQTKWGVSAKGISSGEIDIQICDNRGIPFSIIEALNLNSLNRQYIKNHLDKIFDYDTTGFEYNFILVYVNIKKNYVFNENYINFIKEFKFVYDCIEVIENEEYNKYAEIKVILSKHLRNKKQTGLYHIIVHF